MFRNLLFSSMVILSIMGCTAKSQQDTAFPGEFIGADYLLSEADAERWAMASQQAEQCIYPNLTKIQQQHFGKEDAYIHAQYVFFYPLEKIIGEEYVKMIQEDEKSMGYAQLQFKKFKHIEVKALKTEECEILRAQAKNDLAVVKGQYSSGMVEDKSTKETSATQSGDKVATGDNKFFFDIIKWGAALLL
ncbi:MULTISPECIES: DUF5358 domain-containing protein [Glaesserella]|uniref:DUF5358 domain-containing protein n=1 Tax=Glaesserella australis TaxID=2094024 RepID=A0A328BZL0_9PAST|nr:MULTISPECIES: DUF5358 domain-containing protein [Glaesserella]AUI66483.1 hypothetical protein CJD39_07790 [Glaesserella sp. 15-184]RAL19479.1 hypothetical protein C5N92_02480 [Glaesserella australis]